MIERIAIFKHASMIDEVKSALNIQGKSNVPIFDSEISYTREFIDILGNRNGLFIGITENACGEAIFNNISALTVPCGSFEQTALPIRMIKRALAERKIVKALDSFNPQILIGVGGYNEQKLFQKWTKKQGALYIPIIVAKWPVPDNPVRKIIWKRGISAITDPDIPVIFARGEFLKHYLAEEYNIPPDRIKVYWPKYPQELFTRTYTSPFEENKFNILFAGRFSREKGVMLLPDILKLLIKDLPKTKLTLIGDGQLKNELRKKLREVSEEGKSWRIVGFLPQKEIISYYKNCDALIVPSLCEGFGKVVYEGLMCGAWPVASDVDNIGYLIRDGIDGSLVSQIEPNEFVKKLIERNTQGRKKNINNQYFKKMQNEYPSLTEALDEFLLHIEMGHNDK